MKAAILLLGSKIIESLVNFIKSSAGKIVIGVSLFYLLITLIPFEIKLSDEILNILTGDFIKNLFKTLTFLFPVNFALSCLMIIFLTNHSGIFLGIITKIYRILRGGNNNGN